MADEKDPKDEAAEKPARKPRAPRRKKPDAAKAEPAAAAATEEETTPAVDEPTEETAAARAAGTPPASKKTSASKAAAAKVPTDEDTVEEPKPARRTRRRAEPDPPPAPAATPKRAAAVTADGPPMVRAHAKYVRTSARKARLVCDHIRGKSVDEARAILAHASRDVARDWSKLLESAVANAEHNHELLGDDLRIHAVKADEGPTLKRFRPRAMGRATKIRKRTSHLSITLTPKDGEL
jgi:large subunit ribosomal protein L22